MQTKRGECLKSEAKAKMGAAAARMRGETFSAVFLTSDDGRTL